MTDEPVDPDIFVQYQSRRVQFCCMRCRSKFQADPEAYIDNLPQFEVANVANQEPPKPQTQMHQDSHDDDHDHMSSNQEMEAEHSDSEHEHEDHAETKAAEAQYNDERQVQSASSDAGHDHETDHGQSSASWEKPLVQRTIGFLGKFHPVIVHFPIALLILAFIGLLLNAVWPLELFSHGSRLSLWAGAMGAVAAAVLGWMNAAAFYPNDLGSTLFWHRWMGVTTAVLSLIALGVAEAAWKKKSPAWRHAAFIALFVVAILVGVTGHWGATLIYGPNYFTF